MDEMINSLKQATESDGVFIFNTQPSTKSGEHWICVIINSRVVYYFDSFGRHPKYFPRVAEILTLQCRIIEWNSFLLQNTSTTVCGDYCILFALCYAIGWSLQNFIDWLYSLGDSERRDHTIRNVTISMFGHSSFSSYRQYPYALAGFT